MFHAPATLTILFGTETGMGAALADWAVNAAACRNLHARAIDMATYNTFRLPEERDLLLICSTHGEGDPPETAKDFFDFLAETEARLPDLRFAVLALGDSGYDEFCAAGKFLDRRFEELGATRLAPRQDMDVGERSRARDWIAALLDAVAVRCT
jgi:sulfite reductase (NADPH) flavoprotein alpha-component